jgi:hypothetical protein
MRLRERAGNLVGRLTGRGKEKRERPATGEPGWGGAKVLSRAAYRKMIPNLVWATAYNLLALPIAAGVLAGQGIVLQPAVAAVVMAASTVIVAINAQLLRRLRLQEPPDPQPGSTPPRRRLPAVVSASSHRGRYGLGFSIRSIGEGRRCRGMDGIGSGTGQ